VQLRTTSTQRTYRYVRLCLVGVVVALGVSVGAQIAAGGPLGSVSAAYYTPAGTVFVGALVAVSLGLLALSGRSIEQGLLDIAAILAPVIAIVPTPVVVGDVAVAPLCGPGGTCTPDDLVATIDNGMLTLTVVGAVAVLAALGLAIVQRTLSPGLGATLAAAAVVLALLAGWWLLLPASFHLGAHYAAAVGFFALVTAVAVLAAVHPADARRARRRGVRIAYGIIAAGIVAGMALVLAGALLPSDADAAGASGALFFAGEAAALALFAAFWTVQTVELWDDRDPALRGRGIDLRPRE
jgi:hypothetical protein